MEKRFLLAVLGLTVFVGSGTFWLLYQIYLRKKLIRNLLSLPKGRRFFWYKLKNSGYSVIKYDVIKDFRIKIDQHLKKYTLKADFFLKKNSRKYIGVFSDDFSEKELVKLYYVYLTVFKVSGVIFYDEMNRSFNVFE